MNQNLFSPYEGFNKGNLFRDLYDPYKNYVPNNLEPKTEQEQYLLNLAQLQFAAHELNLYLDVHPEDEAMIRLFNEYREASNKALMEYERRYGPITITSDILKVVPWAWTSINFPWEDKNV